MTAIARQSSECEKIRKQRKASAVKQFHFPFHRLVKRRQLKRIQA
jgi:hypothetical protein